MIFKTEKIGDFEIRYPTQTKTNVITNELESRFAELLNYIGLGVESYVHNAPIYFNGGKYVVDFLLRESKVYIEVDGKLHNETRNKMRDELRNEDLSAFGFYGIRIKEELITLYPDECLSQLLYILEKPDFSKIFNNCKAKSGKEFEHRYDGGYDIKEV